MLGAVHCFPSHVNQTNYMMTKFIFLPQAHNVTAFHFLISNLFLCLSTGGQVVRGGGGPGTGVASTSAILCTGMYETRKTTDRNDKENTISLNRNGMLTPTTARKKCKAQTKIKTKTKTESPQTKPHTTTNYNKNKNNNKAIRLPPFLPSFLPALLPHPYP